MVSKYFEIKTKTQTFAENLDKLFKEFQNKKILIYGAGEAFIELNKIYNFKNKFNIIAISDKKFEHEQNFLDLRAINPNQINATDFDYVLVTNEANNGIQKYLKEDLKIDEAKIRVIFAYQVKDEVQNINYLESLNFKDNLAKLIKKIKNKKIVLYGAGAYFEAIKTYYKIDELNIIAISDRRFERTGEQEFLNYKTVLPNDIAQLNPDLILVATKYYIDTIEDLYYEKLKDSKIKIKPMVKKPIWTLMKEIWSF